MRQALELDTPPPAGRQAPPPPMGPNPSTVTAPHSNQFSLRSTPEKSDPKGRMAAQPRAAGAAKIMLNRACTCCLLPLPPAPVGAPARCSRCIARDAHPWIPPRKARTQHSEKFCTAVAALWHQGVPTPEIGRRLGVTKNTIVGLRRTLNLPERPPRGGAIKKKLARSGVSPNSPAATLPARLRSADAGSPRNRPCVKQTAPNSPSARPLGGVLAPRNFVLIKRPPPAGASLPDVQRSPPAAVVKGRHYAADARGCAWPVSAGRPWRFCDDPREDNHPYCTTHCNAAWPHRRRLAEAA